MIANLLLALPAFHMLHQQEIEAAVLHFQVWAFGWLESLGD